MASNIDNADNNISIDSSEPESKRIRLSGDGGRCIKQSSKRTYTKRRKFAGNQYTKIAQQKMKTPTTISKKKK